MEATAVSRVQLALNVADLEQAVDFYTRLFGTAPAKRQPGYANFAIADPPLKLVLLETGAAGGTLNHLGVEVGSTEEVVAATRRLAGEGLPTDVEENVDCCYALQDKVWVTAPDGARWEVYTVLADSPQVCAEPSLCCDAVAAGAATSSDAAAAACC
jgi:catechol 2,3-dioxygenase-like lactoylglutathione lyase family enzyme